MIEILPLKFRIFQYIAQAKEPITADDIMIGLKSEYEGEKQFTKKRINEYLDSLLAVNMIKDANVDFNEKGELNISYEVTDLGISRVRYLPTHTSINGGYEREL
jgi:hypothetical protein